MNDTNENEQVVETEIVIEGVSTVEPEKPEFTVIKELSEKVENQADAILDAIPEVTESAINIHNAETDKVEQAAVGKTDRNGKSFDPLKHQTNPDGTPKLSEKTGKLLMKRGRKAGGSADSPKSTVNVPGAQGMQIPGQLNESQLQQARVTGSVAASLLFNTSMMLGGKEFAPGKDLATGLDERAAMESAFSDYFIATGKTDFPPGVALTLTIGMYVLPRFMLPTVQTNIKAKGGRIYTWWQNRKLNKLKKKGKKNGARTDTRNDGKRENDDSKAASASLQK